jgi:hypothetical protein
LRFAGSAGAMELCSEEFDSLIGQSCHVLLAYAEALTPETHPETKVPDVLDESRVLKLLDSLDGLMREQNMRATHVFEELRTAYGPVLGDRMLDLELAMNDLDFPTSLQRSKSLRESLK